MDIPEATRPSEPEQDLDRFLDEAGEVGGERDVPTVASEDEAPSVHAQSSDVYSAGSRDQREAISTPVEIGRAPALCMASEVSSDEDEGFESDEEPTPAEVRATELAACGNSEQRGASREATVSTASTADSTANGDERDVLTTPGSAATAMSELEGADPEPADNGPMFSLPTALFETGLGEKRPPRKRAIEG